jgi:hypothetical protein
VKTAAAAFAVLISAVTLSHALARDESCSRVRYQNAGFVERCGSELHSFILSLSDIRRLVKPGAHGGFYFACPLDAMCTRQPAIFGFFITPAEWQNGPKNDRALFELLRRIPHSHLPPTVPPVACPMFDVTLDGMAGRGSCFDQPIVKGELIVIVATDDRVGIVLTFSQRELAVGALRTKALAMMPKFKVDRASGDAGLLRWMK